MSILKSTKQGDPQAAQKLLLAVYKELRQLARHHLAREVPGQTLQPTALVHEAYLRLVGDGNAVAWDGRGHFFSAAAEAMRRILVEAARKKASLKRGGDLRREHLSETRLAAPKSLEDSRDDLLALDEALEKLSQCDPSKAELVKLRYFAGLTLPQAAEALHLPLRTAQRHWTYARVWLLRELSHERFPASPGTR